MGSGNGYRVEHVESKLAMVTVLLTNGHKETVTYDPVEVVPA